MIVWLIVLLRGVCGEGWGGGALLGGVRWSEVGWGGVGWGGVEWGVHSLNSSGPSQWNRYGGYLVIIKG